jgi:tetratricopeptide (TPR) repeat protein
MKRPVLTVLTFASALALAGCGPTKTGIEKRAEARDRINKFSAQFSYDQALHEFQVGQFDRALADITGVIEGLPDVPDFHLLQGRIYLETHRLENAIESFQNAIEVDPEFAEAYYFTGIVFQRWSDDQQAFENYQAAYEFQPNEIHYLLATAESMIALGHLDEARTLVQSKLDYFEHNPALQQILGQIALLEGDPRAAADLYGQAIMMDPENLVLLEELAWVQYDAEMYGQCVETLDLIESRIDEERLDLTHLEARCLTLLDRSVDAHAIYMDLSRQNPSNPSVWIEFGTLAWKLGDYRRVAHCSVRTIALVPERFEGYLLKGLYERQQGRLPEAISLFEQASDLTTSTVMPQLLLGRALEASGQPHDALAAYTQAIELDPSNQDARALHAALEDSTIATVVED